MTIKAKDFDKIVRKFGLETRNSGDRLVWLEYDGVTVVRTRRSWKKSGDLPFQHSIRQQLRLNEEELRKAIDCSLGRNEYIALLKRKGVL